jgi:hypothetical protein
MEEKKNPSFRGILVEFMGYTTGHGFGRLVAATTFVWRIFWTLAILGASAMFAMEVMNLFKLYLSRPVQTSVTVTFEKVYTTILSILWKHWDTLLLIWSPNLSASMLNKDEPMLNVYALRYI